VIVPPASRPNPVSQMPSDPGPLRIRNQRYPRWIEVAGHVLVGGLLVTLLAIEVIGLWFYGLRGMYALLAAFLVVLPITVYGWLQIWDLSRPGPGRGVTVRALYEGLVLGIRRKELGAAVEWTALAMVRPLLPTVHTVSRLKLGEGIEIPPSVRFPAVAVRRVRFAPDPGEDFKESEPPTQVSEATVEIHSGRQFRLIVTEDDAQRLRQWADARGITVCDGRGDRPPVVEQDTTA
jgi:hypothetical protein